MSAIRWLAALSVLVWAACIAPAWAAPGLAECHGMKDLVFVAHQDDDLLFMNPDIHATIGAGGCVQTVYLTAAERGEGMGYMLGRARGVRAAYSYIAQTANSWLEDVGDFDGRHLARFVLVGDKRVSLIHMRLKDPWLGKGWGSLTPLSRAESVPGATAESLGPYVETYDRAQLVATLAAIIKNYQPTVIRHMDDSISIPYNKLCWRCTGNDHPDHIASARLVRDAIRQEPGNYAEVAYVDYPTQERASNLTAAETSAKTVAFKHYAWDDYRYCPKDPASCKEPAGTAASWVSRTYYVIRHTLAPAIAADSNGGYLLFAVGEANSAANVHGGHDQSWLSLGGRISGRVAAYNSIDGRTGLLARDATGRLWANVRNPDRHWRGWRELIAMRTVDLPSMSRSAQGQPAALTMGNDGIYHYAVGVDSGQDESWHWTSLPRLADALPNAAVALDANGNPAVFASDRNGGLWVSSQRQSGIDSWTDWRRLDEVSTSGGLAAQRDVRGLIELYVRDRITGHMLQLIQSQRGAPGGGWDAPRDLGFSYIGQPAIGLNEKGRVAIAALGHTGGRLWLFEGGARAVVLGTHVESSPALRTINGTLYVLGRSNQVRQTYWLWTRGNGNWRAPQLLAPPPANGGASFTGNPDRLPDHPFASPILSAQAGMK